MAAETPSITREQVALAERRIGFTSHPVLSVIETHLPQITALSPIYRGITNNQEQQRWIARNYGFLADALVDADQYTLSPLELVAIWSRAKEVFSGYQRYALAGMVSSAYGVYGADNPNWKKFPRHYLETGKLPDEVVADKPGIQYVMERLDHVHTSLDELDFYSYGTREGLGGIAKLSRIQDSDPEAKAELERLLAYSREHENPVLGELHENFSNGFYPVLFPLVDALGKD